jgi:DNA polymerase-1
VYVVDAHSLIFQVFHALPEMSSPSGEPVSAVYGFARDLIYLIESKKPDCIFCAFDAPGPTFRHELYAHYKAGREEMPNDLASQLPKIRELVEALGIVPLQREGFEADDILATVARACDAAGYDCFLVTGDKDCRQLIGPNVRLYNVRKDEIYDAASLEREWGIRPDQVVDFQSLVGDPTDNVPGIPLIGPKLAAELLRKYGSLEETLAHAGEVSGVKRRENLLRGGETARLSRRLVELDSQVPVPVDFEAAREATIDAARIRELFSHYGFRSLGQFLDRLGSVVESDTQWQADYRVVGSAEEFEAFVRQLATEKRISFDTETTHIWPRWAEPVGYALGWRPGEAYYIPVQAPPGDPCLDARQTLETLRGVLEDPGVEKIGQNLKYDTIVLLGQGVRLRGIAFDTMLASYLLDAGARSHGLDELSRRHLGHTPIPIEQLIGQGRDQKRMDQVPVCEVGPYAAEDADIPLRLQTILSARLREAGLEELFEKVEMPLVEVLAEMEHRGIRVDRGRLAQLSERFGIRMTELETEIHSLAGGPFNIASTRQLSEVLYTNLKLPVVKRGKSGPSTDAEALEQLALLHPLPAKIVEFRQYAKLKNTYVDSLPAMIHPRTGRVHASFHQVVAATGRLSSSDPNLQNIPVRTREGMEIRSAFLPGWPGWRLLAADYSQIELRVLAHFSEDRELCESFARGEDIHRRVASEVFGVAAEDVTSEMRRRAKAVNFGVIYGQSAFGLARSLGIERQVAAEFIDRYFARYPGVERFLARTIDECHRDGFVRTILGRRRQIQGVRAGVSRGLNLPERTAVNTVIQGSAADLIKLAMIAAHERLRSEGRQAAMLLQIHDELVFEVPSEELGAVAEAVREEMCGVLALSVPLAVDLKSGDNWAQCEPWGSN